MYYLYFNNYRPLIFLSRLKLIVYLIFLSSSVMAQSKTQQKLVIAHRGASGYIPEHTMESKSMAYAMGADYIEQDVVLTKDNVPIVIHDIFLDEVTNVSEIFPGRSREDGRFYLIDFSHEEIMKLSVNERIDLKTKKRVFPDRFPLADLNFKLHTLQQEIELIQGLNQSSGSNIGIYPEIKNPTFHKENGKDISKIVLKVLSDYGYTDKTDMCILQCFDSGELKRIRVELKSNLFLTQLMEFPDGIANLDSYKRYADAIGPPISQLIIGSYKTQNKTYNDLISKAHELKLKVHPYTLRQEELHGFSDFDALIEFSFDQLKIDGVFTDFPDKVVTFLRK